jgi:MFS family permease
MSGPRPSFLARALYRREILPWTLGGFALGLVEGATAAVLVKRGFTGHAPPEVLNLAVAFVSGSPAISNLTSFAWANLAHGRRKIRLLVLLLALFGVVVGLIGLSPRASSGLAVTVLSVIAARVIWAGILTVRSSVWSSNYPRAVMAQVTGRIVMVTALGMAVAAALVGIVLQTRPELSRWLYALAGVAGLLAAWLYRRMRVRQAFKLQRAELQADASSEVFSARVMREILRSDPHYRKFLSWLAFYGSGNLMITAQLVILYSDHLHLSAALQVGLLTIVPLLCVPLFTPMWARLFDSGHVIEFRARQCWVLIGAMTVVIAAVFTGSVTLLWMAAVLFGVATAGANLGWNLGHNDFASLGKVQQYMGVNVTLTGMRGLIAPPLGIVAYTGLERLHAGAGRYALFLPIAMAMTGAIGFTRMKRDRTGTLPS